MKGITTYNSTHLALLYLMIHEIAECNWKTPKKEKFFGPIDRILLKTRQPLSDTVQLNPDGLPLNAANHIFKMGAKILSEERYQEYYYGLVKKYMQLEEPKVSSLELIIKDAGSFPMDKPLPTPTAAKKVKKANPFNKPFNKWTVEDFEEALKITRGA